MRRLFRHSVHRILERRDSWVILLGFGLALRVVALSLVGNEPLVGDSLHYASVAKQYLDGNLNDTYWPPGLPLYEAAWMSVFGSSWISLRISMLPWFILLLRGGYVLFQSLHSRPAANLGILLLCVYPEMVHHSIEPLTHLPSAACLVWVLQEAVKFGKSGRLHVLGVGLLMAFLVLLRPSSALLVFGLPLFLFIQRRAILKPFLVAALACVVVGAWIVTLSGYHGRTIWVNESNTRNFYLGNNPWTPDYKTWYLGSHWEGEQAIDPAFRTELSVIQALPSGEQSKAFSDAAILHISQEPGRFLLRTSARIRTLFTFDTFTGARLERHHGYRVASFFVLLVDAVLFSLILALALAFLWGVWKNEIPRSHRLLLGLSIILYSLPYIFSFSHPTYHLAFLPIIAGLAAVPISKLALPMGRKEGLSRKGKIRFALVCLVVLGLQIEWIFHMMPGFG